LAVQNLFFLDAFACPVKFTIVRSAADLTGAVQSLIWRKK